MTNTKTETDEKASMSGHNWLGVSGEQLVSIIQRVERLEEEKANIAYDIRDVFAEAKANGFDVKTIRKILKDRKLDAATRDEQEHMYDLYRRAIGMLPLEEFAEEETKSDSKTRIRITTSTGTISTDVNTLIKSAEMTDKIVNVIGAIYQNGGFTPKTYADARLMEHFEKLDLVESQGDGRYMVTASAYAAHLEKSKGE